MEKYTETDFGKVLIKYTGDTKSMCQAIIDYATEFGFDENTQNTSEFNLDNADDKELAYLYQTAVNASGHLTESLCDSEVGIWIDNESPNPDLIVMKNPWKWYY
jgi:hypothetical protein